MEQPVICVNALESPTVVLDRADATAPSQRQPISSVYGIPSPDPFRDVIKTEPAPDLPSLIGDMMPYLVERGISTPRPTTPMTTPSTRSNLQSFAQMAHPDFEKDFIGQTHDYREKVDDHEQRVPNLPALKNTHGFKNRPASLKNPGYATFAQNDRNKYEPDAIFGPEYDLGSSSFAYQEQQLTRTDHRRVEPTTDSSIVRTIVLAEKSKDSDKDAKTALQDAKTALQDAKVTELNLRSGNEAAQTNDGPSSSSTNDDDDEVSIFSFGNVYDLLLAESTTSRLQSSTRLREHSAVKLTSTVSPSTAPWSAAAATRRREPSSTTQRSTTGSSATKYGKPEATTSSDQVRVLENEVPMPGVSLLKLAGCNIYGRMYRVGRIITELSGPCLECRCTEIGVQCKQLGC